MILFLILNFYLILSLSYNYTKKIDKSVIITFLIFSLLISFSTEILSYFFLFSKWPLVTSHFLSALLIYFFHLRKNINPLLFLKETRTKLIFFFKKSTKWYIVLISTIMILLLMIFIQGRFYPPNNWDSMTYHLPRIIHWIQNKSVLNFPTNITRQIYSPPFSEYCIANLNVLTNNDAWSNLVQWFYLIGILIVIYATLKSLNINKKWILVGIILSATIPEALLEASSTQNDVIHAFFLLSSLYFSIEFIKNKSILNTILIGVSAGLALLSKIIAFFYVPGLLFIISCLILYFTFKEKKIKPILLLCCSALIIIAINFNFSFRKINFTGNISGTTKNIEDGITFNKFGPKLLISTSIKNCALHFDPFFVSNLGNVMAEKAHLIIGVDINEKGTNVFDYKFNANHFWKNHEDSQPNFLHFIFFLLASIFFLFFVIKKEIQFQSWETMIFCLILIQFSTLNVIIRWEPWNSRIHTPLFFEMILFVVLIFSKIEYNRFKLQFLFLIPFILYAYYVVLFNYSRPIINRKDLTANTSIFENRFKKYFTNRPEIVKEYTEIYNNLLNIKKATNIGLIADIDAWEYPIASVRFTNPLIFTEHIRINNESFKYTKKREFDYIYSTYLNKDTLHFEKSIFKNITPNNKTIYLYKKNKHAQIN